MMEKKICFFIKMPFQKRDYKRYGIEILCAYGFKVTVLDMTQVINSEYLQKYQSSDLSDYPNIFIARTKKDALNYIKNNHIFLGIDFMGASVANLFLYRALKKFNIQYMNFSFNNVPLPNLTCKEENLNFINKIKNNYKRILKRLTRGYLFDYFKSHIIKIFTNLIFLIYEKQLQSPKYVFITSGIRYTLDKLKPSCKTKVIAGHTLDYDLYLEEKQKTDSPFSGSEYCVYLDAYFPYHPDYYIKGCSGFSLDPDKYYSSLNKFLVYIENKLGLPVVIAAHPRSRYDLYPDCFQGRKVELGKTVDLIAHAKLVLAHCTTAVNFAVLYKKPVIFLTTDELEKTDMGPNIDTFAKQFNKKSINIDRNLDRIALDKELEIDRDRYNAYYLNYIKAPHTPEKPFWQIVAEEIKNDL